jgi:hypothetical protein
MKKLFALLALMFVLSFASAFGQNNNNRSGNSRQRRHRGYCKDCNRPAPTPAPTPPPKKP